MKDGFIRVACAVPEIQVANVAYNKEQILHIMQEAKKEKIKVLTFPALCLTGTTCAELFTLPLLIREAMEALQELAKESGDMLTIVGLPVSFENKLYSCAAFLQGGAILGISAKTSLAGYKDTEETRYFTQAQPQTLLGLLQVGDKDVPFGSDLLFSCENLSDLKVGAEFSQELWSLNPPSGRLAQNGATVIVNLSCDSEGVGKKQRRLEMVKTQSERLHCAYLMANAGNGESTTDVVYSGHCILAENGNVLAQSNLYETGLMCIGCIDLQKLVYERSKENTFRVLNDTPKGNNFSLQEEETPLSFLSPFPFIPKDEQEKKARCEEILQIQTQGLYKRLKHIGSKSVVLAISGGLDSTLALLVCVRAFDQLKLDRKGIIGITMPGFGTTQRTKSNASVLVTSLGCTLREISLTASVRQHFMDIGQDETRHDVTYENAQARERTQIIMDIANMENGIMIGTGDLSELALGWSTYNGDHMSMYGVNASIPKTLVRVLVDYCAHETEDALLSKTLLDILHTPVSPELLPPKDGEIAQKTEELVGPYELHDFFLFHMIRYGAAPGKILRMAVSAFAGQYEEAFIYRFLRSFLWRFFTQQFKRSCVPDGPKVGSVALSPRGDWHMPSDARPDVFIHDLEKAHQRYLAKEKKV